MKCKLIAGMMTLYLLAGLVPISAQAENNDTTIRIVHTNDIHGYYKATDSSIGFEALKAFIDQQDADLVLDAGDTFHGQAFATVEQGLGIAELLAVVGYDAVTPGNHDWSYGAERLKSLDDGKGFAILAANVTDENGDSFFGQDYLVKEVTADDGTQLKVGVIGVIDDAFYSSTAAENVEGLTFGEEGEKAAEIAQTLRQEEDCDIVVAMTHQSNCEEFVSEISGIDAVIAGHEHLLTNEFYEDKAGEDVLVVEAGYYFQNAGVLSLTYDTEKEIVTTAEEAFVYPQDNGEGFSTSGLCDDTVAGMIASIESRQEDILDVPIGYSEQEYPYSWEEIRVAEQPIGRIVTASYLDKTGADVAMENAGGIRGGIPEGDVTYGDLISISPYGNTLVLKELTGQQILDVVEYSLELARKCDEVYTLQKEASAAGEDPYQYAWPDNSGSVLQFGGIQLEYDMSAPMGSRLSNVIIGGKAIDLEKNYTVAMNNYISGNTEYPHISQLPVLTEYGTCEEALKSYIEKGTFQDAAQTPGVVPVQEDTGKPDEGNTEDKEPEPTNPVQDNPMSENLADKTAEKSEKDVMSTPKTGDENVVWIWIAAGFIGAAVSSIIIIRRRKENHM